jgi:hypothetical protein
MPYAYIIHNKRKCNESGTQIQYCVQYRSKLTKTRTKRLDTTLNPTHGQDIDQSIAGHTDCIMVVTMSPRKVGRVSVCQKCKREIKHNLQNNNKNTKHKNDDDNS